MRVRRGYLHFDSDKTQPKSHPWTPRRDEPARPRGVLRFSVFVVGAFDLLRLTWWWWCACSCGRGLSGSPRAVMACPLCNTLPRRHASSAWHGHIKLSTRKQSLSFSPSGSPTASSCACHFRRCTAARSRRSIPIHRCQYALPHLGNTHAHMHDSWVISYLQFPKVVTRSPGDRPDLLALPAVRSAA